jgi:hypothetical protein
MFCCSRTCDRKRSTNISTPKTVARVRRSPPYDRYTSSNPEIHCLSARATNNYGHVENMPVIVCKTPTHHTRSNEVTLRARARLQRTRPLGGLLQDVGQPRRLCHLTTKHQRFLMYLHRRNRKHILTRHIHHFAHRPVSVHKTVTNFD